MHDTELPEFLELVYVLESYYRVPADKRLNQAESANYFRQLRSFPLDIVSEATERIPGAYPTFFPKAGEWRVVCEQVLSEIRFAKKEKDEAEAHREFLRMVHCPHEYVEEAEPPDSLFLKFDVCMYCGHAKPTINRAPRFARAAQYLATGISAQERKAA